MSSPVENHSQDAAVQEFKQFESLLSDLLTMLVNSPVGQIDTKINDELARLGAWLKMDHVILFQLSEDRTTFCHTNLSGECADPDSLTFGVEEIPGVMAKMRRGESVIHQRPDDLAADGDQERVFAQHGIKSYAAIPLTSGNILLGLLLFLTCRADYVWHNNLMARLEMIGKIFTGVLLRKYTEETLHESHDQVVATLRAIPDMMLEVDQTGLIYDYHLPTYEPVHLPAETLVGQKVEAVLSPDAGQALRKALIGAAQKGYYRNTLHMLDTPDSQRWFELSVAVKGISEANNKRFIVFLRDITERKRAEEVLRERDRLQAALKTEKELHKIKNDLMRTISHEFRGPLAVITLSHFLLTDYYDQMTLEQRTQQLNTIRNQVKKLEQMVGEILSAVRGVFNEFVFEPSATDLGLLCQLSVNEVQTTIGAHHQIIFSSQGYLQNTWVDQRLINRILINLLSNAIKYSPEGSVIQLHALEQESDIVLQISDQGIGISEEDQQRLFEPFFRASNVGSVNGLGLGLTIVRDCVILHQGTITIKSELNRGTVFTIRLPGKHQSHTQTALPE